VLQLNWVETFAITVAPFAGALNVGATVGTATKMAGVTSEAAKATGTFIKNRGPAG
jgi:hypothetical protein